MSTVGFRERLLMFSSPLRLRSIFFIQALLFSTIDSCGAANHEASVLRSWIQSMSSPPSSLSEWNAIHSTPCNWFSITCNSQGFVTEINIQSQPLQIPLPSNLSSFKYLQKLVISDANVSGSIPGDICECPSLKTIDLNSNSLVGSIPSCIGMLVHLEDLILNSNKISGRIPSELTKCASLRNLFLFDNLFTGNIPPELGRLTNLEVLRVGGNLDINGDIPSELGDCSNLTVLGLADTSVSGSLPTSIGKLSKLQTLSIYATFLSGEIPPEIGNCSELVNLFLYANSLSGSVPSEIGKLYKLEQLFLWKNNLVGEIPEEIGNCRRLRLIDISLNSISGTIPNSLGNLRDLEEFMISDNNVSGSIPATISNCRNLLQLQLDTNQISGLIPSELGKLSNLNVFFAWQNQLEGSIPPTLASCSNLQALDLSHNALTGGIPPGLFLLQNLTKLLLISNDFSGPIPPEIGNCSSLVRLRLGNNKISGAIPVELGHLKKLNFLDLSSNRLSGPVPEDIGNCSELQMIDLSNNILEGALPNSLASLAGIQVLDFSNNQLSGPIPTSFCRRSSLNKLILSGNSLSGTIPSSLSLCSSLQLLDIGSNKLSGTIPVELGRIESLEIALNLSCNEFRGPIPAQMSLLVRLSILDLSHNMLEGNLIPLQGLENLVSLNISHNNFTGYLPNTKLFRQLSVSDLEDNQLLCSSLKDSCFINVGEAGIRNSYHEIRTSRIKLAIALLITLMATILILGIMAILRVRRRLRDDESEVGDSWPWQFTPFQKLNFSLDDMLKCLTDSNVIGKGCSGIVYRASLETGEVIAVKKLWPNSMASDTVCNEKSGVRDSFSAEVKTLGSIRHKNIVRFLGCCWNRSTRLLMYDYMPNGSLGSILHERTGNSLEWDLRYQILLGAAQGLAYLHHDCVPPIVHRDIKANNILIGLEFEPYIADFGLAKLVDDGDFGRSSNTVAGSYGYIAPEYGYMMKITEKSDVYSYGVVVLEVLTGKQPIDPTIPDGLHVVDWVRQRKGNVEILDSSLVSLPEPELEEIMQVMGVALLCVNSNPEDRPTMKDVAAMLKEIKHEREEFFKAGPFLKDAPETSSKPIIAFSNMKSYNSSFDASAFESRA